MPNQYILKDFDGGAEKTSLTNPINTTATSFTVVDASTFPAGTNPFVIVVDRGLATEEKMLIGSRIGNSFNVLERAYDGSSAQAHALGSVVEHILDAFTVEQANRYVNLQTSKGDLVVHTGSTTQRVGVGTNDLVLIADSAQTAGVKWGQIEAAGISTGAINAIATQVESMISPSGVPAGVITQYAGTTAPSGWLLCQGQSLSTTTYADLFAAFGGAGGGGYRYGGSGSTFNLPNLKGRVPVGMDATQGEFDNLGETGGSKTHTLITAELPSHQHSTTNLTVGGQGTHVHAHDGNGGTAGIMTRSSFGMSGDVQLQPQSGGITLGYGVIDEGGSHTHTVSGSLGGAGSDAAHNNLQPYIVVNYIIKA